MRAVFNQRLAWKEAGRMGVRSHAALHHVEMWLFSFSQAEKTSDLFDVPLRGGLRRELRMNAMYLGRRNPGGGNQVLFGEAIVAFRIVRRH